MVYKKVARLKSSHQIYFLNRKGIYRMLKNRIMHRNMKKEIFPWLKTVFSRMEMWENVIYLRCSLKLSCFFFVLFCCFFWLEIILEKNCVRHCRPESWPYSHWGAQSASATFNFLSSWQFLVFFLDFIGKFLKFILVLDFNLKKSKNFQNFWAWLISQTGPKNEKKIFFNNLYITFKLEWSFIKLI